MTPQGEALRRRLLRMRKPGDRRHGRSGLRISRGTIADYHELARFHYRAGDPAPAACVLVLRQSRATRERVGVLVVSRPVLNGPWRSAAWGERFATGDRKRDARRINRDLRVISRVVIDPRWRAMGLGARLVRGYLRNPLTHFTEAVAAMADLCPLFRRAGMREVPSPESRRQAPLRRALADAGLHPHHLCAPHLLTRGIRRRLGPALRAWARDSRATRKLADGPLSRLMPLAAASLGKVVVFVHEKKPPGGKRKHRSST